MKKLILLLLFPFACFSQIPNYYNSIDFTQTGDDLKNQLTTLITDTHTTLLPYTSSSTDTWDALEQSDLDIENDNNVLLIYGFDDNDDVSQNDRTRDKTLSCHTSSCIGLWTREHVFAKSLATPSLDVSYPSVGTDAHNLRACDSQMNTSRSNRLFENGTGNAHITSNGNWYVGDEWKGDVARIVMYMYVRYPDQCKALNIGTGSTSYSNFDDMYNVFLDWNVEDPVSNIELQRNDVLEDLQGNRNPFIDNPYLATIIWNGISAPDAWGVLSNAHFEKDNVSIFPTLTSNYVYVSNNIKVLKIKIFNTHGQKMNVKFHDNIIDVESLESGIYFIHLSTQNSTSIRKMIKL